MVTSWRMFSKFIFIFNESFQRCFFQVSGSFYILTFFRVKGFELVILVLKVSYMSCWAFVIADINFWTDCSISPFFQEGDVEKGWNLKCNYFKYCTWHQIFMDADFDLRVDFLFDPFSKRRETGWNLEYSYFKCCTWGIRFSWILISIF